MRYSRAARRWVFVCLLALTASPALSAQSTEADIKARLVHKPLFLRGRWANDNLKFDPDGNLIGNSRPLVFTLAGIDVDRVKLSSKSLDIRGKRVGIAFSKDVPQRKAVNFYVSITVQKPASGDFTDVLNAIFVEDLPHMVPYVPRYWQPYLAAHFPVAGMTPPPERPDSTVRKVAGSVTVPEVIRKTEPEFNNVARELRYSGISTVSLVIDPSGRPEDIRVLHPIGLGLDDLAVAAVSQYVFKPAMDGGKPVPVRVNIEVNFEIR